MKTISLSPPLKCQRFSLAITGAKTGKKVVTTLNAKAVLIGNSPTKKLTQKKAKK